MNQAFSLRKAINRQISTVLLICIGAIALLASFLKIPSDLTALLALAGFALVCIGPVYIGLLARNDEDNGEYLLAAFGVALLSLPVLCSVIDASCIRYAVWISVLVCGLPIIYGAVKGLVTDHDITADVLVSIAIIAAIYIGEPEAAAAVAIIMQIGAFLENATTDHAKMCLGRLENAEYLMGNVIRNGKEIRIAAKFMKVGETVRVRPGERIPVDGTVISGESSVDASLITGESLPRDISAGSKVCAGTINLYGSVDVSITRSSEDSTVSRMGRLIEEADAGKSKIVRVADRWASVIVVLALAAAGITYIVTADTVRAVTVLVVFCPCALVLATPTAIMAAVATASRHGIVVKNAGSVEKLAGINTVLIDKTGTLTTGKVACTGFVSIDDTVTPEALGRIAAAAESRSEHPLGRAISEAVKDAPESESFHYVPGRGVSAIVGGEKVFIGNRGFISENCPGRFSDADSTASEWESNGYIVTFIGKGDTTVGLAILSDTLKPTSRYAVRHLWMVGLNRVMLTGDSQHTASRVSKDLCMDDVVWECLPEDKLRIVSSMDADGGICMVGDGINDAPSLKRASVGISMGGIGNDIALDASDIVFLKDDLSKLPGLVRVARRTVTTIRAGIAFSLILNITATAMAAMGMIGPVAGALIHNVGSVIVILAAAMILRYDPWKPTNKHRNKAVAPASS